MGVHKTYQIDIVGGIPKPPPPKQQNSTDLGSALRGVTLKKAASAESNGKPASIRSGVMGTDKFYLDEGYISTLT